MQNGNTNTTPENAHDASLPVALAILPERVHIRHGGSRRHVVCTVRVADGFAVQRQPLTLGIVLDRSGSMSGTPLQVAKGVAQQALSELTPDDQIAVLAFDSQFDVVQELQFATPEVRRRASTALGEIEARGGTALHEGWLRGCRLLASDRLEWTHLSHLLLLTDGQANEGLTHTRTIARQVADIREQCNIGTSTFGLGDSYNQYLLGYMSMAGGGQFTHLRSPADLEASFLGVLGHLRSVVVRDVRLELETPPTVKPEVLSQFWYRREPGAQASRCMLEIGDLIAGEERRVVVRVTFPHLDDSPCIRLRGRLLWRDPTGYEHTGEWQQLMFTYAPDAVCDAELRDPAAMHWVGLAHADRAKREAMELNDAGHAHRGAQQMSAVASHMASYAGDDVELCEAMQDLQNLATAMSCEPMAPAQSKEQYYQQQMRSRGQRNYRDK